MGRDTTGKQGQPVMGGGAPIADAPAPPVQQNMAPKHKMPAPPEAPPQGGLLPAMPMGAQVANGNIAQAPMPPQVPGSMPPKRIAPQAGAMDRDESAMMMGGLMPGTGRY
ncbi:MAG: hypothetical protein M3O09_15945 [Acidobacteriota bacterium]|nr:hypothetical protein [Acidobacteriota bacterium]